MKIFKVGEKIKCIAEDPDQNPSKLIIGNIYTVSDLYGSTGISYDKFWFHVEELEKNWYYQDSFFEKAIQDNEFVKMMCSNERMLDLP